jgi:thioesterase domain-containing protein
MLLLVDPATPGNGADPAQPDEALTIGFLSALIRVLGGGERRLSLEEFPLSVDFESHLRRALRLGYLPSDADLAACHAAFRTYCRTTRAIQAHVGKPYDGAAMLVRPHAATGDRAGGDPWIDLLPADAPRRVLGEDHRSMIRGAHAGRLAALLRAHQTIAS